MRTIQKLMTIFSLASAGLIAGAYQHDDTRTFLEKQAYLSTGSFLSPAQKRSFYNFIKPDLVAQQRRALALHGLEDMVAFDTARAESFYIQTNADHVISYSPELTRPLDEKIRLGLDTLPYYVRSALSDFNYRVKTGALISTVDEDTGKAVGKGMNGQTHDVGAVGVTQAHANLTIIPVYNSRPGNVLQPTKTQTNLVYAVNVLDHEIGHYLDYKTGLRSMDATFMASVRKDLTALNWRTRSFALREARRAGLPEDPDIILNMPDRQLAQSLEGSSITPSVLKESFTDGYMNVRAYLRSRHFGKGQQETLERSALEIKAALISVYLFRERQLNSTKHPEDKLADELTHSYAIVSREMQNLRRYYAVARQPFLLPPPQ